MPRRSKPPSTGSDALASIAHRAKRKNLPPSGIESHGELREEAAVTHSYWHNPHLPPRLRSAPDPVGVDRLREVLTDSRRRALTEAETRLLDAAIRQHEPWLEWSGKRERPWFEVDPVALHMHERVSTQAILRVLARKDVNRRLFADPELDYAQAVQFYRHDVDWANRMILGDSLQVMASLARREDLAGKVQMIYVDPPYGVNFRSNFQPEIGRREVKDTLKDFTREPEMIRAYRDTWTLGIHSYLDYLRDRFTMMRELLAETGSIFVQISDENVHRVRCVLDEVFGSDNFVTLITFRKRTSATATYLGQVNDYLLWYGRSYSHLKYRQLFRDAASGLVSTSHYTLAEDPTTFELGPLTAAGKRDSAYRAVASDSLMTGARGGNQVPFDFRGGSFDPGIASNWKTDHEGLRRLERSGRVIKSGTTLRYKRYQDDFPVYPLTSTWSATTTFARRAYVVQTSPKVIQRCMLMTTDPGDLVLDPTCGSGTTAFVAEQWGRRWITIDTSRVALTLAKHRLMTAKFDYYGLRELEAEDQARNPDGPWISSTDDQGRATGEPMTFRCKRVPHVTLRSIARNASLDPVFEKHEPLLATALDELNAELAHVGGDLKRKLAAKLVEKHRAEGARSIDDGDIRRWLLPGTPADAMVPAPARKPFKALTVAQVEKYRRRIPDGVWRDWEVPFDADPDWPAPLAGALTAFRRAWRSKMSEVDACIEANAESEELVDSPDVVKGTVRVAGPFTMEGVIALEEGLDSPIGGAPNELETFDGNGDGAEIQAVNAEAHLAKMLRLLKATGVDFAGGRKMKFTEMEPIVADTQVHADGYWENGAETGPRRVAVSIGPEAGNVSPLQVEEAIRAANRVGYDDLVFAGFGFDAAAQEAIEDSGHPKLRLHMALINPDVAMDDLLQTQPGSQIFTVFSAPRVVGPVAAADGRYTVEVEGMDVYDPVKSTLHPTDKSRIAAWFLDTDYDGRTFCVCQAFFPDRSKWNALAKALGDADMVERGAFSALSGLVSLPFERPARLAPVESWRVAVKVIDPRGNEGLRVLTIADAVGAPAGN